MKRNISVFMKNIIWITARHWPLPLGQQVSPGYVGGRVFLCHHGCLGSCEHTTRMTLGSALLCLSIVASVGHPSLPASLQAGLERCLRGLFIPGKAGGSGLLGQISACPWLGCLHPLGRAWVEERPCKALACGLNPFQVPASSGSSRALWASDYPEALVKMQNLLQQVQGGAWYYSHAPRGWISVLLVLAYTLSSEDLGGTLDQSVNPQIPSVSLASEFVQIKGGGLPAHILSIISGMIVHVGPPKGHNLLFQATCS